jgi:iron complex outermembrane receptor protein
MLAMRLPVLVAASMVGTTGLFAQDTSIARLPPMVTVTRQPPRSPFDLPFGISVAQPDSMRPGQAHIAADQTLLMIPGLVVANRNNPSQDVRVSVRGFGARSQFGVRSLRVMRDGMPLTLPDGQTPLDYLDLESVGRIEVIRGTAAALYGNASGGVIDIRSADPSEQAEPEARVWFGSNALQRSALVMSGTSGALSYQGNIGETAADNFRAYSHQRLTNGFGKVSTTVAGTSISLIGLGLHMPVAENPGALTQAQLDANPEMADSQSVAKRARKAVDQIQIGLLANRAFGPARLSFTGYGGTRSLYNPLTFAVVDVERTISGASLRGDLDVARVAGLRLSAGADFQLQNDNRKNWANCNGQATATANCPKVNVEQGVLQLDQREFVTGFGPYALVDLERGRFHADAGVRSDAVRFELDDHFLSDLRDDSGRRTLRAVSPMGGIGWRLTKFTSLFANVTTAFETPTTTELGNQSDGSAGLNRDLQPQYSTTMEAGFKGLLRDVSYDLAGFHTRVRDELIPFQIPGGNGRTYFRNAGATRRDGVEVSGEWSPDWIDLSWAYGYSHFRFINFVSGTNQFAGKAIPGIPEHQVQLSATHRIGRGFAVAEWLVKSRVWANDANTVSARRFDVLNLRAGKDLVMSQLVVSPTVAVNNVLDRRYAGSVAVNATTTGPGANKFFEPAPGRTLLMGARVLRR